MLFFIVWVLIVVIFEFIFGLEILIEINFLFEIKFGIYLLMICWGVLLINKLIFVMLINLVSVRFNEFIVIFF